MRVYCKGKHIVGTDPSESSNEVVRVNGVATPKGQTTAGGIILLADTLKTSGNCHEIEIVESAVDDLQPGDRALVYLGGDDGSVTANGISAFFPIGDKQCFSVPDAFVWAKVKDGEILPRHGIALVSRDDAAMKKYAFNDSALVAPDVLMAHGVSASGASDPRDGDSRSRDVLTVLYCRVERTGPDVKDPDLQRGAIVCFSPSYSCARVERLVTGADGKSERRDYCLVDSEEIYFSVDG